MSEHVLIVGGGIAGLTLAAALDPSRFRVTLVEERPERAGAGTVLALWRGAMADLDRLGVGERIRAASITSDHGTLRDSHGGVLARHRVPRLCFAPRPELVAAFEAVLPTTVTRLTCEVTDPRALATEVGADLVVGADGVRSVCRQACLRPSGVLAGRGFVARSSHLNPRPVVTEWIALRGHLPGRRPQGPTEWWGPGGVFGVTPGPRGAAWFCAVRTDQPDRRLQAPSLEGALALATNRFGDWDPLLQQVLAEVGGEADVQRILLAPPLRRSAADGLVLIGDAAHGMAPNLGRGANEAIRDATVLAAMLHRHGAKGGPLAFPRRRHATTQVLRLASSVALRTATTSRLAGVRDHVLRMLPQQAPPTG
ncbi:FAD-dependent oxidoreductase [Janibacter cremeus]|uniref:2-polyprenyl-6-methoxyphenol hydroxylase-like FAD-dependent oxidoreductase n=1 Tax=Janibacter cremeus TaxID=1285192 RepID=A0A852VWB2_9MICO|nr:NAD(P)/FAD-dependent oxidoreductase [Janibacter cremeus]NYF98554.1 2-polyprenyl-6-methoxyphenol hydroxylase-like FAD-dependent oxidoreductase [Janibacter cremeus]